jgi:hypothetical protein
MKLNKLKFPFIILLSYLIVSNINSLKLEQINRNLPDDTTFGYATNDNILQNTSVYKNK